MSTTLSTTTSTTTSTTRDAAPRRRRALPAGRAARACVAVTLAVCCGPLLPVSSADAGATPALPPGPGLSLTADTSWWGTNGRVTDIVTDGSSAWVSGGFDYVGPSTGHAAAVDAVTGGRTSSTQPVVDGVVLAAAPDGSGGYLLGGDFDRVGDLRRAGVARIRANGTVDRSWSASTVDGTVTALATGADGTTYVASQSVVSGRTVAHLDALTPDGTPVPGFSASPSAPVLALRAVGSSLYVGGELTSLGATTVNRLARLDASTGAVDPSFSVGLDDAVLALDVLPGATRADDVVAVGGRFTLLVDRAGFRARGHLATVTGSGTDRGWGADTDGEVRGVSIDPAAGRLYLGGTFSHVAGSARTLVAAVGLTGGVTGFAPALAGCHAPHYLQNSLQFPPCAPAVDTIGVAGGAVRLGGTFTTADGAVRHDAAAYDTVSGRLSDWSPLPGARVRALTTLGASGTSPVVLGGDFTSVGGQYHRGLARIDLSTGRAYPGFRADTDDLPLDLELGGGRLYVAGSFKTVGRAHRGRLAALDPATGAVVSAFDPRPNKTVYSIAVRGPWVYAGGLFTTVSRQPRLHVARVDAGTGAPDPAWNRDATGPSGGQKNGAVFSIAATADGSRVFLAGGFTAISGTPTPGGIVALSGATGAVLPQNLGGVRPTRDYCGLKSDWIQKILLSDDGTRLYGGAACPDELYQWDAAALSAVKTSGLNWITECNGGIQGRLEVNGHFYYGSHGGDKGRGGWCFTSASDETQVSQQRLFAFSATDAAVLDWAPEFDSPMGVWSFAAVPQGLLVGGDFTFAGDRSHVQQGLALFRGTP